MTKGSEKAFKGNIADSHALRSRFVNHIFSSPLNCGKSKTFASAKRVDLSPNSCENNLIMWPNFGISECC